MATKKEIAEHLKIALSEVGEIKPWVDKEVNAWVFSHPNYPVEYAGEAKEEVIKNYPKYLKEFIVHRLDGRIGVVNEKDTKGRGGYREGAGRPLGSKSSSSTVQVRVPSDIAIWLKKPGMISHIRGMLQGYDSKTNLR